MCMATACEGKTVMQLLGTFYTLQEKFADTWQQYVHKYRYNYILTVINCTLVKNQCHVREAICYKSSKIMNHYCVISLK